MFEAYAITLGEAFRQTVDEVLSGASSYPLGSEEFKDGYRPLLRLCTLMEQTAEGYGIPLETLSLDGLDESSFIKGSSRGGTGYLSNGEISRDTRAPPPVSARRSAKNSRRFRRS